ncbi:MAG: iron-containing alcohol dehydrogenase [Bacilli bacterium]
MSIIHALGGRVYQGIFYLAAFFLPFREPKVLKGVGTIQDISAILLENKKKCVLIVTDQTLFSLGLLTPLLAGLQKEKIIFEIYSGTVANPTIDNVEEGLEIFKRIGAEAIIAFGGGSPLDCAKMIGARATNPKKSVKKMKGLLKVRKKLPLLIAVPTTAGTGSEVTIAAVIVDKETQEKYPISDPKLIPDYAVLDPELLVGLPPQWTSTTGMDALTHAVEAYTNRFQIRQSRKAARYAVRLIDENLLQCYQNPHDLQARENMQVAAYQAGLAFTRGYVGNIHALAHTFGGFYDVPHGLANAVIMPHVLKYYGKRAYKRLAELCDEIELLDPSATREAKTKAFIKWIEDLNKTMQIPTQIKQVLKKKDLPIMVKRAYREAYPLYPTSVILTKTDFQRLFAMVATISK